MSTGPVETQRSSIGLAVLRRLRSLATVVSQIARTVDVTCQYKIAMGYLFHPRPDDIFIVSFPKSGTSLLQMMLYQLTTDGEVDFPHIDSVSPWFERDLLAGFDRLIEAAPSPRIFKSHLLYSAMPRGVKSIYIARDLRDVVLSAFHHHCMITGLNVELAPFVDQFLAGRTGFRCWFKHLESWWPHRNDPNVLFLRYEEVVVDLAGTARRVAAFYGLPLDEARLARVIERCSLAYMKQLNAKFDPRLRQLGRGDRAFIRKGAPGEGRGALAPAQEEQVSRRLAEIAQKLGCSPDEPYHQLLIPDLAAAHTVNA